MVIWLCLLLLAWNNALEFPTHSVFCAFELSILVSSRLNCLFQYGVVVGDLVTKCSLISKSSLLFSYRTADMFMISDEFSYLRIIRRFYDLPCWPSNCHFCARLLLTVLSLPIYIMVLCSSNYILHSWARPYLICELDTVLSSCVMCYLRMWWSVQLYKFW